MVKHTLNHEKSLASFDFDLTFVPSIQYANPRNISLFFFYAIFAYFQAMGVIHFMVRYNIVQLAM